MNSINGAIASVLNAQHTALASKIATTVAAKSLDATKQQGQALAELIESVAQAAKDNTKGQLFDALA